MRRAAAIFLSLACALTLGACGDTLQDQPIGPGALESVILKSRFPAYWVGLEFDGLRLSGVTIDPSDAVSVRYGDCVIGGEYTCVTPLQIVTSPDNSFVPGGAAARRAPAIRGADVSAAQGGDTLAVPTGDVVVSVYADHPSLARRAVSMMAPLNEVGLPLAPLPAAVPDTGFDRVPLPTQVPSGVSVPRGPGGML